MSRMADLVTDVESRMNNTTKTDLVKQWINQAQDEIQVFSDWPFLITEVFLQTTAVHTDGTGTINITNASTNVTGTATAWTAAMVGRKFRISSDNEWYTIKTFNSATDIDLDRNYEGTTSTTADYVIFQDVYKTIGDAVKIKTARNLGQSLAIQWASNTTFDFAIPTVTIESSPRVAIQRGRSQDTYTTGTISGTSGAKVITGDSTAWTTPAGLTRGVKLRVGNFTYTVNTVDTATQITIYENISTDIAALTTYSIALNNIQIQLWPPPDTAIGIPYKYFRKLPPLVNDWDESEIPERYHRILIEGACKRAFIYQFDQQKYALAKAEFNEGLLLMRNDFRQTTDIINIMGSDDRIRRKDIFLVPDTFPSS